MIEIEHSGLLEDLFGHWPDFHDAEVRALRLQAPGGGPASLEADIEGAEMSREVDERGYFRDRQRCMTTLRFDGVLNVRLDGFRYQNVLDEIEITEIEPADRASAGGAWGTPRYRVRFLPIPAFCEIKLLCSTLAVVAATPVARAH